MVSQASIDRSAWLLRNVSSLLRLCRDKRQNARGLSGIRLRSYVTPDGIGDHLIRKHNIPLTVCAFPATDRGEA